MERYKARSRIYKRNWRRWVPKRNGPMRKTPGWQKSPACWKRPKVICLSRLSDVNVIVPGITASRRRKRKTEADGTWLFLPRIWRDIRTWSRLFPNHGRKVSTDVRVLIRNCWNNIGKGWLSVLLVWVERFHRRLCTEIFMLPKKPCCGSSNCLEKIIIWSCNVMRHIGRMPTRLYINIR